MTEEQDRQRRDLNFSQRAGELPLPEPLQPQHLTKKFRNSVWHAVDQDFQTGFFEDEWSESFIYNTSGKYWKSFFFSLHTTILVLPHDEDSLITEPSEGRKFLRKVILEQQYHKVLTVVEHMFRCPGRSKSFDNELENCFNESLYVVDRSIEPICIFPVTSEEMKKVVSQSLDNINQSELIGAKSHLHKAAEELSKNHFAASIRESIHAVEAAVRKIDPKSSNKFSNALDSLEKNGMLKHSALKGDFASKTRSGDTSDFLGIRHPLIENESADVEYDEAILLCTAPAYHSLTILLISSDIWNQNDHGTDKSNRL